jgi:hypothetical protein
MSDTYLRMLGSFAAEFVRRKYPVPTGRRVTGMVIRSREWVKFTKLYFGMTDREYWVFYSSYNRALSY